ncbi:MAG TPA: N-acetylmuramoyl-L-alanine amidase [Longimicrobiales bacterium]
MAERVWRLVCAIVSLALVPASASAQQPVLRLGSDSVRGVEIDGAAAFPAHTLETLGFRLADGEDGITAILGGDTIRFWTMSPFFHVGRQVHQLAFPPQELAGVTHLPEQFFIQWLPGAYPDRFAFQRGSLVMRGSAVTTVARSPAAQASPAPARATEKRLVIIDPGHGGKDPGRIGPNGLREKDVALSISRQLARLLRERGYEVQLTRTSDTYISLPDRPRLANEWKADRPVAVFLSIHANAAPATAARGFETFFLSEARTADERRVAEMENEAIRFDDQPHGPADGGLEQILNTLRSDFLMRASHDLAAVVQQHLASFHPGPNRGVKRAGFHVLVGTIMPAVLIETAFISNRQEARMLGTKTFQEQVAQGIADSVDEFFRRNEHLWVESR